MLKSLPDLFKEHLHQLFGFPFIEAQVLKQFFRHVGFR
jgi:hypothetical protein